MKKALLVALPVLAIGALVGYALFRSYHSPKDTTGAQYVSAETFRQWLAEKRALVVDVQTREGYDQMHFPDSIPTHAYPVVTPAQRQRVDAIVPALMASDRPIVLVCFGGITGAPNARLQLLSRGVPNRRLYILEGGSMGWPWKGMMERGMSR